MNFEIFGLPANNQYRRAMVTANRPLVCACTAHKWVHRRGFGLCQLNPASKLDAQHLNFLNRYTRETSLSIMFERRANAKPS